MFLEDLNVKGMVEQPANARNKHDVGWRDLIEIFTHHGNKNGCHVVTVPPEKTTIDCAACGCSVEKPLYLREHACPTCGFTIDRDWNAALNVLIRGLNQLGVGHSEATWSERRSLSSLSGGNLREVRKSAALARSRKAQSAFRTTCRDCNRPQNAPAF